MSSLAPLPWPWRVGHHVTVIGETDGGKSTLVGEGLLPHRRYLLVNRTKMDPVRRQVKYPVQVVTRTHKTLKDPRYDRIELRTAGRPMEAQARENYLALSTVWAQGGWTVYDDEEWYLEEKLGLKPAVEMLLTQGGGKGITMVMSAQRPAQISRFVISQSAHVICFGVEGREAKTIADATSPRMGDAVLSLSEFSFAWYYRPRRGVFVGKLNLKTGAIEGAEIMREKSVSDSSGGEAA
jgi:hypothetical protein